jgi:hypothetical protein
VSLFLVKHQHPAEACPARDAQMAPMLLQHLSHENAAQHGVTIRSEAVIDGGHTLYLVVDADDSNRVERYMAPFAMAGSVEVLAASPCEQVVARAAC